MKNIRYLGIIVTFSLTVASCNMGSSKVDVSGIEVEAAALRFEQDLFGKPVDIPALSNKYGSFFDVFTHRIINIPEGHDTLVKEQLKLFVNDPEVRDVFNLTDSAYKNMGDVETGMMEFLKHLRYYFPDEPAPRVITFISAFNYAVITTDSAIGIGLDMFLGPQTIYYPQLGIPKYMFEKFRREYIIPSAVKAWFQSEYDIADVKNEFLSQMIYQGKLIYYSKLMIPSFHDTLITGYSKEQLEWCENNQANIWSFFIENKMLFNADPSQYAKFVNDGPTTSGFPEAAPGKIGAWVGWQIVSAYADKSDELSPEAILNEKDAQKILEKSGYKPKK